MFWENAKVFGVSFAGSLAILGLFKLYTLLMNGPLWFIGFALVIAGVMLCAKIVLDAIFC
jgi:hypothetical protein